MDSICLMVLVDRMELESLYSFWNTCRFCLETINYRFDGQFLYQVLKSRQASRRPIDDHETCNLLVLAYRQEKEQLKKFEVRGEGSMGIGIIARMLLLIPPSCYTTLLTKMVLRDCLEGLEIFSDVPVSYGFVTLTVKNETIMALCGRINSTRRLVPSGILRFIFRQGNFPLVIRLSKEMQISSDFVIYDCILKCRVSYLKSLLPYAVDFDGIIARAMKADTVNTLVALKYLQKD